MIDITEHLHQFVTVETDNADLYVGTLDEHEGRLRLRSGLQGHPVYLTPEQIAEILPADRSNPHLERVS